MPVGESRFRFKSIWRKYLNDARRSISTYLFRIWYCSKNFAKALKINFLYCSLSFWSSKRPKLGLGIFYLGPGILFYSIKTRQILEITNEVGTLKTKKVSNKPWVLNFKNFSWIFHKSTISQPFGIHHFLNIVQRLYVSASLNGITSRFSKTFKIWV